ncbi:hypothetical protein C4571_03850 [Candidatus Parcubacteria bacterium]|nr:MAG: hypothetical protein C4571_03850 [Candidatus Parcubacteria bacterium]
MMSRNSFEQPGNMPERKNPLEKISLAVMLLDSAAETIAAGRHVTDAEIATGKFDKDIAKAEASLKTSFNQHGIEWGDSKFQRALEEDKALSALGKALFKKMRNVITLREENRLKNLGAMQREEEQRFGT